MKQPKTIKDFEIHITCPLPSKKDRAGLLKLASIYGWHTSSIKGDPLLGTGSKFYFTAHKKSYDAAVLHLKLMHEELKYQSIKVLRTKIEGIMWDKRYD